MMPRDAHIPTGSSELTEILSLPGFPRGRLIEYTGPSRGGKTTFALCAIAATQKAGGTVALIDAAKSFDIGHALKLGVDVGSLLVSQPDSLEQVIDVLEALARSGATELIVIDDTRIANTEAEDRHYGLDARLWSQCLRKLCGVCERKGTTILFLSHAGERVGVTLGSGEVTSGGNAMRFYCSIRADFRPTSIGTFGLVVDAAQVKIIKNKLAAPFRSAVIPMPGQEVACPDAR